MTAILKIAIAYLMLGNVWLEAASYQAGTREGSPVLTPGNSNPAPRSKPVVQVTANKGYVNVKDRVIFTARVTGGTPPYTFFWWLGPVDKSWTSTQTNTYQRDVPNSPNGIVNIWAFVRDAQGVESDHYGIDLPLMQGDLPGGKSPTGCFRTSFGNMTISNSNGQYVGTYKHNGSNGRIEGKLSPDRVLNGYWYEDEPVAKTNKRGTFSFRFTEDWKTWHGEYRNPDGSQGGNWWGEAIPCEDR